MYYTEPVHQLHEVVQPHLSVLEHLAQLRLRERERERVTERKREREKERERERERWGESCLGLRSGSGGFRNL